MENSLQSLTLIFAYVFSKVPRMLMGFYKYQIIARGMEQGITLQREDRQLNEPLELNISNCFHMWLLNTAWTILRSWNKAFNVHGFEIFL